MKKAFIITGANGDIAISMAEIIREEYPEAILIGTDSHGTWPAKAFFDDVIIVPLASHPDYVSALAAILKRYKNSLLIPTSEPELRFFAHTSSARETLSPLMNDSDLILKCMDKLESINWLTSLGIDVPATKLLAEATEKELPILAKPRWGAGSRGIEIIRDKEHLLFSQGHRKDDPVAQEYLDVNDQEYTCAILRGYGEDVRTLIMHRQMKGDVTGMMKAVHNEDIEHVLVKIAQHLSPLTALNVQLRLTAKGPMIFEINPRFSSTVKMRHLLGFKDFLWLIRLKEGQQIKPVEIIYDTMVYRVYKEVVAYDK